MKENLINVIGSLLFAGGISATAVYAGDTPLDANKVNKMLTECKIEKSIDTCEKEIIKKCSRQQTAKDCEMMIQQAKAGESSRPVTSN